MFIISRNRVTAIRIACNCIYFILFKFYRETAKIYYNQRSEVQRLMLVAWIRTVWYVSTIGRVHKST